MEFHWVYKPHLEEAQCPAVDRQHKTKSVVWEMFCLAILCLGSFLNYLSFAYALAFMILCFCEFYVCTSVWCLCVRMRVHTYAFPSYLFSKEREKKGMELNEEVGMN